MRYLLLLVALFVAACSAPAADAARETQATTAYEHLAAERFDALRGQMTPSSAETADDATLRRMADFAPEGEPESSRVATWNWQTVGDTQAYQTLQEFEYPDRIVLWQTTMVRRGDEPWRIDGVYINSASPEAAELARFTLSGRPPQSYAILAAAVVAPILCLITVVVAALRRRWGWMVASFFGVGQFTLNWTTGEVFFELLRFALFGAGFMKTGSSLDPWMIFFAVPVPAILFWLLGRWRPKPAKPGRKSAVEDSPPV